MAWLDCCYKTMNLTMISNKPLWIGSIRKCCNRYLVFWKIANNSTQQIQIWWQILVAIIVSTNSHKCYTCKYLMRSLPIICSNNSLIMMMTPHKDVTPMRQLVWWHRQPIPEKPKRTDWYKHLVINKRASKKNITHNLVVLLCTLI